MHTTVLAVDPPTSPQEMPADVTARIDQALGWTLWGAIIVAIAAVMLIGTLLVIDNRLVDEYGPSIQAIAIKVIAGCFLLGIATVIAGLFVN